MSNAERPEPTRPRAAGLGRVVALGIASIAMGVASVCCTRVAGSAKGEWVASVQSRAAERFICTPAHLGPDDILTLNMSIPHGRDLAITDPDNRFYFVAFSPTESSGLVPLVDWEQFGKMPEVHIETRGLRAPGVDSRGWHSPTAVFTKPGKYRIVLGENLETENNDSTIDKCDVRYDGPAAPNR